jgi:hypothetical protein
MLMRCLSNSGLRLRVVLCALVVLSSSVAYGQEDPTPATNATVEGLLDSMMDKYLGSDADPADPVVQALQWRRERELAIRILGDPAQSYYQDPQYTERPLPRPILPHDPWLTVPPEVMEDYYRRFILEAKEPVYVTLKQDMIFNLRRDPKFCAHFVRFDFDLEDLSQVQLEILTNWSRGGHNNIMLMGEEIGKFADFLGAQRAFFNSDIQRQPRDLVLACSHPVATDCSRLNIAFDWRENLLSRDFFWEGITATKTPDCDVVAFYADQDNQRVFTKEEEDNETEEDKLVAAYGRFKNGMTDVYFRPYYLAEGPDGERFELNWMLWIQGMIPASPASPLVPAAGELNMPSAQGVPEAELPRDVLYRQPGKSVYEEPFPVKDLRAVTQAPDSAEQGRDDQPSPAEPADYGPESLPSNQAGADITDETVILSPAHLETPYTQGLPQRKINPSEVQWHEKVILQEPTDPVSLPETEAPADPPEVEINETPDPVEEAPAEVVIEDAPAEVTYTDQDAQPEFVDEPADLPEEVVEEAPAEEVVYEQQETQPDFFNDPDVLVIEAQDLEEEVSLVE